MNTAAQTHSSGVRARIIRVLGLGLLFVMVTAACSSTTTTTTVADTAAATAVPAATEDSAASDGATTETPDAEPTLAPPTPEASSDEPEPEPTEAEATEPDAPAASSSSVLGDGDFCAIARSIEENDPFAGDPEAFDFDVFSEEFFTYVIDLYDNIAAVAPAEIADDVAVVRGGMTQMQAIASEFDYNLFDPGMAEAFEVFETAEFDTASMNIEAYLSDECGIDTGGSGNTTVPSLDEETQDAIQGLDDIDDEDLALLNELFISQFNLSPELQECVLANIPDLTQAAADPAILQQELCGTTLFNIFQGLG